MLYWSLEDKVNSFWTYLENETWLHRLTSLLMNMLMLASLMQDFAEGVLADIWPLTMQPTKLFFLLQWNFPPAMLWGSLVTRVFCREWSGRYDQYTVCKSKVFYPWDYSCVVCVAADGLPSEFACPDLLMYGQARPLRERDNGKSTGWPELLALSSQWAAWWSEGASTDVLWRWDIIRLPK